MRAAGGLPGDSRQLLRRRGSQIRPRRRDHDRLRDNQILYDRDGEAEFFQVYTHAFDERFFFEIVQRRDYHGFGAVNAAIRLAAQSRESRPLTMPKA